MSQIKVGPIHYKVEKIANLRREDGEELHGEINDGTRIISLNQNHTRESRFVTTWHEIIHSFEHLYGLTLTEKEVTLLGTLIAQTLQDNPQLNWSEYAKKSEEL